MRKERSLPDGLANGPNRPISTVQVPSNDGPEWASFRTFNETANGLVFTGLQNFGAKEMRICFMMAAVFALASPASAEEYGRPTAILVSPIHEAQVVRGDDGKDHVEYELLVVNVFPEPVTLSSVTVLDPAGKELMRIEGADLAAATQTLFAKTATPVIPASAAVSVDVDLILPPGGAPERLTHRIAYALKVDSELALLVGSLEVDAPEVAVNRQPAIVIGPPLKGNGWLATSACCKPNVHRDERIAIDGVRIETAETFAVDWVTSPITALVAMLDDCAGTHVKWCGYGRSGCLGEIAKASSDGRA